MSDQLMNLYAVHKRSDFDHFSEAKEVLALSRKLNEYLSQASVKKEIAQTHSLGATSHQIQNIVKDFVVNLGFSSEKKGLFKEYDVAGLRSCICLYTRELLMQFYISAK